MEFTEKIQNLVRNAENKALATSGPHGINVVPVSTVRVKDRKVWLVNYFMEKTEANIKANPEVALTCWSGLSTGCQIKGAVEYKQEGAMFERVTEWAADAHPDRTVQGVIAIEPEEVNDVSPTDN